MWFWIFMFVCNLLIPLVMIISGRMMEKHPPKNINGVCGYRTAMSMKNKDTWNFAQETCGRLWWKAGWLLLLPSIAFQLPFYGGGDDLVGTVGGILCTVQCIVMIGTIWPVERALKKHFNREGTRK